MFHIFMHANTFISVPKSLKGPAGILYDSACVYRTSTTENGAATKANSLRGESDIT